MHTKRLIALLRLTIVVALSISNGQVGAQDGAPLAGPQAQEESVGALSVLWPQQDNAGANYVLSTDSPGTSVDAQAAEDFIIPAGTSGSWTIEQISVSGVYQSGTASSVNVNFYSNSNGLPGTPVYTATLVPASGTSSGNFVIPLGPTLSLPAGGTYWVSIQAVMGSGQWQWVERKIQTSNPSAWRNSGAFSFACINWQPRVSVCGQPLGSDGPDLLFTLEGTSTIVGAAPLIFSVSPSSLNLSSPDTQITVNGANFGSPGQAVVKFEGNNLSTAWVNASTVTALVRSSDLISAGVGAATITVRVGVQDSNGQLFTIGNALLYLPLIRR